MIQYPAETGREKIGDMRASCDPLSSYFNPDENSSALCQATFFLL